MFTLILLLICLGIAYILGSLCSAVIVCQLFNLPDPRTSGSNNPGATNVLRISGKKYGAMVLFGDFLKGLLAVWLANMLNFGPFTQGLVGLAAVLGHVYPVFFEFKGGKGVATTLGVLYGFQPLLGLIVTIIWMLVAYFSRYASLASMIAVSLAPLIQPNGKHAFIPFLMIALIVIYQHRNNITRLREGNEPKIKS
ncbi:MAG: glycerol-3-phosphate 1-O-acyltransferase PlsY [Legionella sp.]|jgi:glycerol-3-phosphate acyltransferase PlsY|nr:glycerol-3-phosphate 1-O-acyltransferase PlsY [Legionella sp.]